MSLLRHIIPWERRSESREGIRGDVGRPTTKISCMFQLLCQYILVSSAVSFPFLHPRPSSLSTAQKFTSGEIVGFCLSSFLSYASSMPIYRKYKGQGGLAKYFVKLCL